MWISMWISISLLAGLWSCFKRISKFRIKASMCFEYNGVEEMSFSVEFRHLQTDFGSFMNFNEMAVDMKHTEGV